MGTSGKALVTGATGFVGAALTRHLVSSGCDVRIFRRESSNLDLLGRVADDVEHAVGDITFAPSLYDAMEGVDRVYHVAAKVSFSERDREVLRRINVDGTANVVNAALRSGVERLVHTSSVAALGRPQSTDTTIDETTAWADAPHRSAYACSKRQAELEVHRGIAEGLDAVIVNPSLVFGVGNAETNTRRIVDAVRSGWAIAVPGGGTNVVDVRDVAAGHQKAMHDGESGRRYLLGSENRSWEGIITVLAQAFGVTPPRYTLPEVVLHAGSMLIESMALLTRNHPFITRATAQTACRTYRYDNHRACEELGCSFRPFEETAQRIAHHLQTEEEAPAPQNHGGKEPTSMRS